MKNKTRLLAAIAALSMISAAGVFAEEAQTPMLISEQIEVTAPVTAEADYTVTEGTISELSGEESYIVLGAEQTEMKRFNIGEETVIIHADGTPASLADCKENASVRVYHSTAATFSIPPQSFARVVILTDSEELLPMYAVVRTVTETEDGYSIETADGEYIFNAAKDVSVVPYRTKNIVKMNDVQAGSEILVWSETMTMSLPAQANPEKIMLLPFADAAEEEEAGNIADVTAISVNGEKLDAKVEFVGGKLMLPVRAVSEKLGYTVTWNGEEQSVLIAKGDQSVMVYLNQASKSSAAMLIGDLTYVPHGFFDELVTSAVISGETLQLAN